MSRIRITYFFTAVTSKARTFVYKGTVKGYAKKVVLTLKVVEVDKEVRRAISYSLVLKEIQGDWTRLLHMLSFVRC